MKNLLVELSNAIMTAYVLFRSFTTFVILPFTEPLFSFGGMFFLLLVLIAACATVLSFTRRKKIAALLAIVVGLLALGSWCHVIFIAPVWIRSNFVWFVVPELGFSLAGLCKWWITRSPMLPEAHLGKALQ